MNKNTCPHCGGDLTEWIRGRMSSAGSTRTEKKTKAGKANMAKLNEAYTGEKRKAAAAKLTPEQRSERARKAVQARWAKNNKNNQLP